MIMSMLLNLDDIDIAHRRHFSLKEISPYSESDRERKREREDGRE